MCLKLSGSSLVFPVKNGSELKEWATISMNCQNVESTCKDRGGEFCKVKWIAQILDESFFICTRKISVDSTNKSCFVVSAIYKNRTTYQPGGVVNIKDVRRNESGIYKCECKCGGKDVESKSYHGVIILCE